MPRSCALAADRAGDETENALYFPGLPRTRPRTVHVAHPRDVWLSPASPHPSRTARAESVFLLSRLASARRLLADEEEPEPGPESSITHRWQPPAILAPSLDLRDHGARPPIPGGNHLNTGHTLEPLAEKRVEIPLLALHDHEPARHVDDSPHTRASADRVPAADCPVSSCSCGPMQRFADPRCVTPDAHREAGW